MAGRRRSLALLAFVALLAAGRALAWGPDGHRVIGGIAGQLIAGSPAATQVHAILGDTSLAEAAVWADCARSVDPREGYAYRAEGRFPECRVFETAVGEAAMRDFVRRNDRNCAKKPGEASCHKQYHYADVAIQRSGYRRGEAGTRDDDIVAAVQAAMRVLQGEPAPPPFDIRGRREALLLLAHYVGDIHQPLHVGAIYLDEAGRRVDPDATGLDPATETRGGNAIEIAGRRGNLHALWDSVPRSLAASSAELAEEARALPATRGDPRDWPRAWAADSVRAARRAYDGLTFSAKRGGRWQTVLPADYEARMDDVKRAQLVRAGARLAQLLHAIWQ